MEDIGELFLSIGRINVIDLKLKFIFSGDCLGTPEGNVLGKNCNKREMSTC